MRYVILKTVERRRLVSKGAASSAAARPTERFAVEVEDLKATRVAEIARMRSVKALAPAIPMKLIAPVASGPAAMGSAWGVASVGADTSPFSGEGVVVAVLDTGIDATHPAFAGVELLRKNFTSEAEDDLDGHGTHCAGAIFGRAQGTRIGVAPGVRTALIGKVLGAGGGGSDTLVRAIEWALHNGANVISMSLGVDFPGYVRELEKGGMPTELATSKALEGYRRNVSLFERLAADIHARGAFMQPCLVIAAAGNESRRDEDPEFEIAVSPPAVCEGIVSVAALGPSPDGLVVAPFSNVGARVAAPGVDVLSAWPGGGLATKSGTSQATPHVAGVAALWAEKLRREEQLTANVFMTRVLGSGTMTGLKPGFHPADVGTGIVRAPQQ